MPNNHSEKLLELGYPHELILFSKEKAKRILNENYLKKVKLLAKLFLKLLREEIEINIEIRETDPVYLQILSNLEKGSENHLQNLAENISAELNKKINLFKEAYSQKMYDEMIVNLKNFIFTHLISKEIYDISLITHDIIQNVKELSIEDEISVYLRIIGFLENQSILDVNDLNDILIQLNERDELSVYFTYKLSHYFTDKKQQILLKHYKILRNIVKKFNNLFKEDVTLDDTLLDDLFRVSIILFICEYADSLRLPKEEQMNYIEHVASIPTIQSIIDDILDKRYKIEFEVNTLILGQKNLV